MVAAVTVRYPESPANYAALVLHSLGVLDLSNALVVGLMAVHSLSLRRVLEVALAVPDTLISMLVGLEVGQEVLDISR
jgi:hypothetical protein